jgi:hypothetical protein
MGASKSGLSLYKIVLSGLINRASMEVDRRLFFFFKYFFHNVTNKSDFRVPKNAKTHKYSEASGGEEYFLEPLKGKVGQFTMTSTRSGVKQHDYIQVQSHLGIRSYKILKIRYYSDSFPVLWIAKLASVD